MEDLTVILPTYNEGNNPGFWKLIEEIRQLHSFLKIIVVDDGSDDLKVLLDKKPELNVKYLRGKAGESESIEFALRESNTKYITVMDSDGSHPASFITESYQLIKNNENKIVVGSRYEKEGRSNATYLNRTISKLSNKFAQWTLGQGKISSDLTGRLFTSTRKIFLSFDIWYGRGDAAIALLYNAKEKGIDIQDIPITYTRRTAGQGSTDSLKGIIKYLFLYFIRLISIRLDKHKPFSDRWIERAQHDWSYEDYKIRHRTMVLACFLIFIFYISSIINFIPGAIFLCTSYPNNTLGYFLRNIYWKKKCGSLGQDVLIGRNTEFFNAKHIYIENRVIIDHNVTIIAPSSKNFVVYIDSDVTIHSNCYLNLKSQAWISDKSCIGHGCYIFTDSNQPGGSFSYATRPHEQIIEGRSDRLFGFKLGKNSYIGTNSTVVSSHIEDNTIIGANSFVRGDRIITGYKTKNIQSARISQPNQEVARLTQ